MMFSANKRTRYSSAQNDHMVFRVMYIGWTPFIQSAEKIRFPRFNQVISNLFLCYNPILSK
ncbi:hypothetical protein TUM17576_11590 [Enterobacter hormaechei]|nr:hypothetical protein TUM17576_11590 [Enterobacter hormaechei]